MSEVPHNLHRSIDAAISLRQELERLIVGQSPDLSPDDLVALRDTFDGETTLDAEIRRALISIEEDEILTAGIKAREAELKNRRLRIEKRTEATRGLIEQAMTIAEWPRLETDIGTVTLGKSAPRLEVEDESQIPTQFWKPADPTLDKAGLKKVLTERHKAFEAAKKIEDETERAAAFRKVQQEFPSINGARLETEGTTLTIRRA
jgi:hypothetical protein